MSKKYSEEDVAFILEEYEHSPTKDTVHFLAEKLETSPRSIIGKLSRLGVYQKTSYVPKYAETPILKEELVLRVAELLDLDMDQLIGLTKSQKPALLYLVKELEKREKANSSEKI